MSESVIVALLQVALMVGAVVVLGPWSLPFMFAAFLLGAARLIADRRDRERA